VNLLVVNDGGGLHEDGIDRIEDGTRGRPATFAIFEAQLPPSNGPHWDAKGSSHRARA
jgi:hypothetical protein